MDLGDIFKEKLKWTEDELSSLLSILTYQASIDGKIDEEEKRTIENAIFNLPGTKPLNWNILVEKSIELGTTSAGTIASINTLKKMHSNKRKLVIASLYNVADADGNVDEKEKEVFINIAKILNINTGKKNFSDLGFQIKDGGLYTAIKFPKSKGIEEQQKPSQKTLSECDRLESNLRSLSPCIADADFWNEILNKRAQSRIMFREGMGQTFHDSANGHHEEYMLKYENEQMTIEDIYNRIDVYNLFIEQYEKYFIRCQELDIDVPSPIENKFFALIESLAGAELTLLLIKEKFDEEIDEEKIFKVVERPNNGIAEDDEDGSNPDIVDQDIFTYYKGYLFNGTLICHMEDSKHEISMRFGLQHGSYKKYDKKGKIIENNLAWNDKVFRSMPCK
jgi:uncharacterized tellurite resistance protein B-like protein